MSNRLYIGSKIGTYKIAEYFYKSLWEDVEKSKRPDFEQWYKDLHKRIYSFKGCRIDTRRKKRSFLKYLKNRNRQ